jgi:methionine-gamma-lyase
VLPQFGIDREEFGVFPGAHARAGAERPAPAGRLAVIFIETPANPTNDLIDIAACAEASRREIGPRRDRPLVVVDNTFLGPLWQHPLECGADLVDLLADEVRRRPQRPRGRRLPRPGAR